MIYLMGRRVEKKRENREWTKRKKERERNEGGEREGRNN